MSHAVAAAWPGHSVFLKPHIPAATVCGITTKHTLSPFFFVCAGDFVTDTIFKRSAFFVTVVKG